MYQHTVQLTSAHLNIVEDAIFYYETQEETMTRKRVLTYLKQLHEDLNLFGNAEINMNAIRILKKEI